MKILDKTEDGNLDEQEKIKKTSQETEWELKPQYVIIALVVFVTFCCCILFFFMIYRYNGFTDFWKKLSLILQPIIIGVVIAYLLNPIMKFLEGHLLKFLEPRMKSKRKAKKTSRGIAITGSLVFLVGICVLLVAAIVPSISASIQSMITSFPQEAKDLTKWVDEVTNGDTELASMIQQGVDKITDTVETFFEDDIFSKVQTYLTSITSGVIYGVKFVLNVIVGLIISVYVMADQEHFAGQAKKIVYAMFKPVRANVIVDTVRKSNEIFSGFISGKILDSAIIGVLAYIVLAIMKMPDTVEPRKVMITFFARGNFSINCVQTDSNSAAFTWPSVCATSKPSGLIPNTFSASSSFPRITSQPATSSGITSEAFLPYFQRFLR